MKFFSFAFCFFLLFTRAGFAQSNLPAYVPQNGLVGWWPFSGNAADSSGRGNHGLPENATLTTDRFGRPNRAYQFGGDSSLIEVRDTPSLQFRQLTLAAWVFLERGGRQQLIYKGRRTDAYGEGYFLNTTGESGIKIGSNCQPNVGWRLAYFGQQLPPVGEWVHLCTTYDGIYLRNYYNGGQADANPISGQIDICDKANLRFGYGQNFYSGPAPLKGKLDDIGLWNRALSPAEVLALYRAGGLVSVKPLQSGAEILLFPNPGRGHIVLRNTGVPADKGAKVLVSNVWGRVVLEQALMGVETELNLAGAAAGLYLVTVTNAVGVPVFREKLVVE